MAFKMKAGSEGPFRKNFPSAFKDNGDDPYDENRGTYGTSARHLKSESYQTRVDYKNWKSKQPRGSNKSFNAYLSRNDKETKVKRDDYGSLVHLDTVKTSDL